MSIVVAQFASMILDKIAIVGMIAAAQSISVVCIASKASYAIIGVDKSKISQMTKRLEALRVARFCTVADAAHIFANNGQTFLQSSCIQRYIISAAVIQ